MSCPSATAPAPDGSRARPAFERIALLLQVAARWAPIRGASIRRWRSDLHPDGCRHLDRRINSALIAGNPPRSASTLYAPSGRP